MAKERVSFRFDSNTIYQLEYLYNQEIKKSETTGISAKSKVEIVEEAIEKYYLQTVDQSAGDPYLNKMNILIKDIFKQYFTIFIQQFNANHSLTKKNQEYLNAILNCLDLPDSFEDMNEIVYSTNKLEDIIDQKIEGIITNIQEEEDEH